MDVDAIIVPYGGGGLSLGIAIAAKGKKPGVKVQSVYFNYYNIGLNHFLQNYCDH